MIKCVNINSKSFKTLASQVNYPSAVLEIEIAIWQEQNETDEFPTIDQIENLFVQKALSVEDQEAYEKALSELDSPLTKVKDNMILKDLVIPNKTAPNVEEIEIEESNIFFIKNVIKKLTSLDFGEEFNQVAEQISQELINSVYNQNNENKGNLDKILNTLIPIKGLTMYEYSSIYNFIYNNIENEIDFDNPQNVGEVIESIKEKIENKYSNFEYIIQNVEQQIKDKSNLGQVILFEEKLKEMANKVPSIENGLDTLISNVIQDINKERNLDILENKKEKDFNSDGTSVNYEKKLSKRVKKMFKGVPAVKQNGTPIRGFLGLDTYIPYQKVIKNIISIINEESEVKPNLNSVKEKLTNYIDFYPEFKTVINNINNASVSDQNGIVTFLNKRNMDAYLISVSRTKDAFIAKILAANFKSKFSQVKDYWKDQFFKSSVLTADNILNGKVIEESIENINRISKLDINKITLADFNLILNPIGITLSEKTFEEIKNDKMKASSNTGGQSEVTFRTMVKGDSSTLSIINNYYEKLKIEQKNNPANEITLDSPFLAIKELNNVMNSLAELEYRNSKYATNHNYVDGGKKMHGFTLRHHLSSVIDDFKTGKIEMYSDKSFNKISFLLELIKEYPEVRELIALNDFSQNPVKTTNFNDKTKEYSEMTEMDKYVYKLNMFANLERKTIDSKIKVNNFSIRMANLPTVTMADRNKLASIAVPVINFNVSHFDTANDELKVNDVIVELMYNELVLPEITRKIEHVDINDENYNILAKNFTIVPLLNSSEIVADESKTIDEFNSKFKESLKVKLKDFLNEKIKNSYINAVNLNIISNNNFAESRIDTKYLISKVDSEVFKHHAKINYGLENKTEVYNKRKEYMFKVAMADYALNSLIHNANQFKYVTGDLALYGAKVKSNMDKHFVESNFEFPKTETSFQDFIRDSIETNAIKRFASMLSNGEVRANSDTSVSTSLVFKSHEIIGQYLQNYANIFYGKKSEASQLVKEYFELTDDALKKEKLKKIAEYSKLAPYTNIDSTDAIVIANLHVKLDNMLNENVISEKDHKYYTDKYNKQEASDNKEFDFTPKELARLLEPGKDVKVGFSENGKVLNYNFLKFSEIYLIKQMTRGQEIDKMRKVMYQASLKSGTKNVRAYSSSAVKLMDAPNEIEIFNEDGTLNDIENFDYKVVKDKGTYKQQSLPDKEGKNELTYLFQMAKILMSDGVEDIVGSHVKAEFDKLHIDLIELRKEKLYTRMGIDPETLDIINYNKYVKVLNEVLKTSINAGQGFTENDAKALEIEGVYNEGKIIDFKFKVPMILQSKHNKVSSLFASVVSNNIANITFPGKSFAAAPGQGFMKKVSDSKIGEYGTIIKTSNYKGGKLENANIVNGVVSKVQIIISSEFNHNGKTINFFNADGTPNNNYVKETENGYELIEGVIDPELLEGFSIRIPSSSHGFGTIVEIVGFLPPQYRDTVILPENLIAQKGLDFDIDKEYIYMKYYSVEKDGKIKVYNSSKQLDMNSLTDVQIAMLEAKMITEADLLEEQINEKTIKNKILDIYINTYKNPAVMSKALTPVSMTFAEEQRDLFKEYTKSDSKYYSMSDEMTQSDIFQKAEVSALAIGTYANAVSFNALSHSVSYFYSDLPEKNNFKMFGLTAHTDYTLKSTVKPKNVTDKEWDTISRSKAEMLNERLNISLDELKVKALNNLGITQESLNVDIFLTTALGFDKILLKEEGEKGVEISAPALLLNQPLIREYNNLKKQVKSKNLSYKDKTALWSRIKEMKKNSYSNNRDISEISPEQALSELIKPTLLQNKFLAFYIQAEKYAEEYNTYISSLSTSNILGTDLYSAENNKDELSKALYKNLPKIQGFSNFIYDLKGNPRDYTSSLIVNSLNAPQIIFNKLVYESNKDFKETTKSIAKTLKGSDYNMLENTKYVQSELKTFLWNNANFKLFDNIQKEKQELFFDYEGNDSLPTTIKANLILNPLLNNYEFINSLILEPSFENNTAKMIFESSNDDKFFSQSVSVSLIQLAKDSLPLSRNNKKYNSYDLVKDIVRYHIIKGNNATFSSGASYIPIELLEYFNIIEDINIYDNPEKVASIMEKSNFKAQFYSRNYKKLTTLSTVDVQDNFLIQEEGKILVALNNTLLLEKKAFVASLNGIEYVFFDTSDTGIFSRMNKSDHTSKSYTEYVADIDVELYDASLFQKVVTEMNSLDGVEENLQETLNRVILNGNNSQANLAKYLSNFVSKDDLVVFNKDIPYSGQNNQYFIEINSNLHSPKSLNIFHETILEETLHRLTYTTLSKWVKRSYNNGVMSEGLLEDAPEYVKNIFDAYNIAKYTIYPNYDTDNATLTKKYKDAISGIKGVTITEEERGMYAFRDIFEFTERIMREQAFREKLDSIPFTGNSKESILKRIIAYVKTLLANLTKGNVSYETVKAVNELITINYTNNSKKASKIIADKFEQDSKDDTTDMSSDPEVSDFRDENVEGEADPKVFFVEGEGADVNINLSLEQKSLSLLPQINTCR